MGQFEHKVANAQKHKYFQIPGRVRLEKGDPTGAIINLINQDSKQIEDKVIVPSSGKFDLNLNFFNSYRLLISKEGYYDKEINISTVIPQEVWEKDSIFPPFNIVVTLYKRVEGVKLSFEGKPIGRVVYSPNGSLDNFDSEIFIDDDRIQDEIITALKSLDEKKFNQKVAEAVDYEKKNDFITAIETYREASKMKPSDKFVKEKIKELTVDLKNMDNDAKIMAEFDRLMAAGENNMKGLNFPAAIDNFKEALSVKPKDELATSRLAEGEKQLALQQEKRAQDILFNQFIASGDEQVNQTKLNDALSLFEKALALRPGDAIAVGRITKVKTLLLDQKQASDALEASFAKLVAQGDQNVAGSNYETAISNYKSALEIKPGEMETTNKLNNATKLLLNANEALNIKTEDFNRLMSLGEAGLSAKNYPEALTSFKGALQIKRDAVALAKITETENLIRKAEEEKATTELNRLENEKKALADQQKRYRAAVDKADAFLGAKQYSEAKSTYQDALGIDKTAFYPSDKIREIDRIITEQQQAAVRARAEETQKIAQFNEAMKRGSMFTEEKKYAQAIGAYREAQNVNPHELSPLEKIKEVEGYMRVAAPAAEKEVAMASRKPITNDGLYDDKIKMGDQNYGKAQWSMARFYYIEALKYKQGDPYALEQIDKCDRMISEGITAERLQEYKDRIAKADRELKANNYSAARFYYRSALDILSWENYPKDQLNAIDKIFADRLNDADRKAFSENLTKADESFNKKDYSIARFYYNKANAINPNDYISSRLKEIESIVNGSETKKLDASYQDLIKKGDEALNQKNSSIARFYYQKAKTLKPNESYPIEMLKKLDSGL